MQHGHLDAELAHELHVVLDHDHRMVAGDLAQELGGRLGLGVGHAGDRLVDQQQLRVLRQQHADLEPLLLAVRQTAGQRVAVIGRAAIVRRISSMRRARSARGVANSVARTAASRLQRQQEVVLDRVALEHGRLLELAADAELGDLGLVELGQVDARRRTSRRPRRAASCR